MVLQHPQPIIEEQALTRHGNKTSTDCVSVELTKPTDSVNVMSAGKKYLLYFKVLFSKLDSVNIRLVCKEWIPMQQPEVMWVF